MTERTPQRESDLLTIAKVALVIVALGMILELSACEKAGPADDPALVASLREARTLFATVPPEARMPKLAMWRAATSVELERLLAAAPTDDAARSATGDRSCDGGIDLVSGRFEAPVRMEFKQ